MLMCMMEKARALLKCLMRLRTREKGLYIFPGKQNKEKRQGKSGQKKKRIIVKKVI